MSSLRVAKRRCHLSISTWLLSVLLHPTALWAAGGDIVITRDVPPRVATRQGLPDPHPQAVNAAPTHYVGDDFVSRSMVSDELSDLEFSNVSSGQNLPPHSAQFPGANPPPSPSLQPGLDTRHSGGLLGGVSGQVNRSVQQGLRPLQSIGGR